MKYKKHIGIIMISIIVLALALAFYFFLGRQHKTPSPDVNSPSVETQNSGTQETINIEAQGENENQIELVALPGPDADDPKGTEVFIGQLQALDTGCFADAECYVIVDDKKITTMIGGRGVNQENLGQIQGFDSFAALFNYIGSFVEVKALRKEDGSYTLYGSSDYYIKLF